MAKNIIFPLLVLVLFAAFSAAISVDEYAGTYLNSGESFSLTNFTSGGISYSLVKING